MLKKITKPLIIALVFYIVIVLYGLISFHPLPIVFNRGIKAFLIGFLLSLAFKIMLQYFSNLENEGNNLNDHVKEEVNDQYQKEKKTDENSKEKEENHKNKKEFNPLDPPVLETEEE
ncbi:MAG: hypothetical protein ACOCZZ_00070 [Bacillota bacterium]